MQITDPSQLSVGQEIFCVHAFSDDTKINNTTIHKYILRSYTTTAKKFACMEVEDTNIKAGVDYLKLNYNTETWKPESHYSPGVQERSLQDAGIIPNTYNAHRTYDNLWEAQQYIDTMYGITATTADPADGLKSNLIGTDYDRAMGVV